MHHLFAGIIEKTKDIEITASDKKNIEYALKVIDLYVSSADFNVNVINNDNRSILWMAL